MDVLQHLQIWFSVLGFQIDNLAADHAVHGTGGASNLFDDAHAGFRRTAQPRQCFVRLSLQRITGQNCDCLAKNFVASGPAAA